MHGDVNQIIVVYKNNCCQVAYFLQHWTSKGSSVTFLLVSIEYGDANDYLIRWRRVISFVEFLKLDVTLTTPEVIEVPPSRP